MVVIFRMLIELICPFVDMFNSSEVIHVECDLFVKNLHYNYQLLLNEQTQETEAVL